MPKPYPWADWKRCADTVKEYNSDNSSDYANLLWDMGCIYFQIYDKDNAAVNLNKALKIYSELWANEPELLQPRLDELKSMAVTYGMNTENLISVN